MRRLLTTLSVVLIVAGAVSAQRTPPRPPRNNNPNNNKNEEVKKGEISDLSAEALGGQWKDAYTLAVKATVKNIGPADNAGGRKASLWATVGEKGKKVKVKTWTTPALKAGATHTFVFETAERKHWAADVEWSLELDAGDNIVFDDVKSAKLEPGPNPGEKKKPATPAPEKSGG